MMKRTSCSMLALVAIASSLSLFTLHAGSPAEDKLVVHEWGTFTVLQDSSGAAIQGVNINEEALPEFVHRLSPNLAPEASELAPAFDISQYRRYSTYTNRRGKGITRAFRLAVMRMETPIIYFYPPGGRKMTLDVSVGFRNGWLSEWFPQAENVSPGYPDELGGAKPGSLAWRGLEIGVDTDIPTTGEHVWLAPRQVASARVRMPGHGQSEQYLFYRGVAQLPSPISVRTSKESETLVLYSNLEPELGKHPVKHLWLADIRKDGSVAFRVLDPVTLKGRINTAIGKSSNRFPEEAYEASNLALLRESMHAAIVEAGLFEDEATAMLDTWELSYFKSAGMRLFYVLPDAWTNYQLPLNISEPAEIKRVMIGRVELVTPQQEKLVATIASGKASTPGWLKTGLEKLPDEERRAILGKLESGKASVTELEGIDVPEDYRAYINLGRFRDAIVLNWTYRSPEVKQFARNYGISLN